MGTKEQEKNIPHIILFLGGGALSLVMVMQSIGKLSTGSPDRQLFSPCIYAFVVLVIMGILYLTKRHRLEKYHQIFGGLLGAAMVYAMVSRLDSTGDLVVKGLRTLGIHFSALYFVAGLILSLRFVPVVSKIAQEIAPGSHMDLKVGYLALNIAIYSTHTFSTFFFTKKLDLCICDYGYIGALSVFYMVNMLVGSVIDKHQITKKAVIFGMVSSTGVYSVFLICKNVCKNLWVMGGVFGVYLVLLSPVFALYDVLVLGHISKTYPTKTVEERKEVFSRIRMWASFGHALAGMVISYITWLFTDNSSQLKWKENIDQKGFTMLICVLITMAVIFVAITFWSLEEAVRNKSSPGGAKVLSVKGASLVRNPNFLFFLFVITAIGVTRGISSYYLVSYMHNYFGIDFSKVTSVMCLRTISEMAILYYSKHLLKYFGYYWLLFFSLAAATIREFNYAHMPKSEYILAYAIMNEMFKGISSACLIFSAINIADRLAGTENKALAQTCYSGCYNGMSLLFSSLLSIAVIQIFKDFRSLFLCSSMLGFVCSILIIIKYGLIDKHLGGLKKRV